ncbi:MAG: hypothetical protein E7473_02105 [Ruminococcaceae bacterium]|nr:hypothetical protein [Oscillospiraceae bacterium]
MANNEAIAKNVPKVYEAGKVHGYSEGVDSGEQSERNRFWEIYTGTSGIGTDWRRKFANPSWKDAIFTPPFTAIKATQYAGNMFHNSGICDGLKKLTEIDISETKPSVSSMHSFANSCACSYFPILKFPGNCDLNLAFAHTGNLKKIEKLVVDETNTYTNTFASAIALESITIEGIIAASIDFRACPLSTESLVSVVEHLSDSTTNQTATFKETAINKANWDITDYGSWEALTATKPNWTILLV